MVGYMIKSIRKDLFHIESVKSMEPGYVVLKTSLPKSENPFLRTIWIVREKPTSDSKYHNWFDTVVDADLLDSITDGDIGFITQRSQIRTVLSQKANHNTVLVTEQCDNLCKFCSQPPKKIDDEWLMVQAAMAVCAYQSDATVGISGGEPTLKRQQFVNLLRTIQKYSPQTPLHILTNGRSFSDVPFVNEVYDATKGMNVTFGIPIYAIDSDVHDELVGSNGAFQDTLKGLINAGNTGLNIELRVIPTIDNLDNLVGVIELAVRCLSNIVQVSVMNLEPTGWAKKNWSELYVDPREYQEVLKNALSVAKIASLPIKLFNYPLCHLDEGNRKYAVKSISDWKNYYPEECDTCILKAECSGYFTSSKGKYHQIARRLL
jgi:His-Xaa-Ser system radical SAM maturase HxsC